jgi:phosphatidyl-myo-inositol dimannoside synthase
MAIALSISSHAIEVLPMTFDAKKFEAEPKPHFLLKRYQLGPDQPVILTIARLASVEQYKGYDQVLRALPAVKRAFPDVQYILGGRGSDRPRAMTLIRKLGLTDAVILAGYIPDHELRAFYNLCDIFTMPSKGEGFGIVFLEALACGRPVIAGNKHRSVDAVINGKLGVLADPDNLAEIAEALVLILTKRHPLGILPAASPRRGDCRLRLWSIRPSSRDKSCILRFFSEGFEVKTISVLKIEPRKK